MVAGLGVVALVKSHSETSESGGNETTPTIVTVQTGALKLATLHGYVQGYGTIEPASASAEQPAASAPLAAPSAGVVTKVNVIAGQPVTNGEVLVELIPARRRMRSRNKNWHGRRICSRSKTRR